MTHGAPLRWRKSSYSGSTSDCIEVPQTLDRIRDSKNESDELKIGQAGWASFLVAAKSGQLVDN